MTDSMQPMLRALHEADGDRAKAGVLLRMPDALTLKYHLVIEAACRRAGFEAGWNFLALRVALCLAVRDDYGLPPGDVAEAAEEMRRGLAAFANIGGDHG